MRWKQLLKTKFPMVVKELKVMLGPGLDGIPNVVLKTAILVFPKMYKTVLQKCLVDNSCFPDI